MLALFESIGGIELIVVGIGALLVFGKDLPRVAADAGAQFTKLKRSLDSTWRETGLEREMRQIRDAIPRDLSLTDVARTASEKLAVRLEEEDRARQADTSGAGPVARGSTAADAAPAPVEHVVVPPENVAVEPLSTPAPTSAGIDPASEFRSPPRVAPVRALGAPESDEPPSSPSIRS